MPVFNAEEYIHDAIQSILKQTFKDFEFLIIDDRSTDFSQDIVKSFNDSRITLLQNQVNMGVASTLNKGIALAKGEYIARMDADDISAPTRLAKQVALMDSKKKLGICGAWVQTIDPRGKGHRIRFPADSRTIRAYILFDNPLNHPVVMMRRRWIIKHNLLYDPSCPAAQDYELWSRCASCFDIENIKMDLLNWRINPSGVTHKSFKKSNETVLKIQKNELDKLNIKADNQLLNFHRRVGNSCGLKSIKELQKARLWLEQLIRKNDDIEHYPKDGLRRASAMVWFNLCMNSSGIGIRVPLEYIQVSFLKNYFPPVTYIGFFILNSMIRLKPKPIGTLLGSE